MWLSVSIWLPALACLAQATSDIGHLFVYDPNHTPQASPRRISPQTARLMIASRLGLDRFHTLGSISQDALEAINDFGPTQQPFTDLSSQAPVALILSHAEDALGMSCCKKEPQYVRS